MNNEINIAHHPTGGTRGGITEARLVIIIHDVND